MSKSYSCYVSLRNIESNIINQAFEKTMDKIYGDKSKIPRHTTIKLSSSNNGPFLTIIGSGSDNRCSFCNYFVKVIGEEKIERDCFIKKRNKKRNEKQKEIGQLRVTMPSQSRRVDDNKSRNQAYKHEGDKRISESYATPIKDEWYFSEDAKKLRKNRGD